ncbi:unnamed protein product [Cuscuta epithymum]|uniref:DNA-binding protein RHL1 n=1 Tax=Cuscuta epithymum TaxID=186058 RepID=A0AAV0GGU5_9ASTE|nr:unnamed protein product [Cuscuta epithymum]
MVSAGGKKVDNASKLANPEVEEQRRLKKLAFSKGMLSETPLEAAAARNALHPSQTVIKHHGKDIIRKSQRSRNRFLFSFPGLLAPVSGGKIGELKDLGTKNPILYLDFPQGQMKLFGTIVYPKNMYLSLQFSRGGKSVICDDYFNNMIVFSDAWWIGRKDENPEELRLEFPKELNVHQNMEHNFKGGAGAAWDGKQRIIKSGTRFVEHESPKLEDEDEDDTTEDQSCAKEHIDITPTRHSARTVGKTFNFADVSSEDNFTVNDAETSNEEEVKEEKVHASVLDVDNEETVILDLSADKNNSGAKVPSASKEPTRTSQGSLIQASISNMFKKMGEKIAKSTDPAKVYSKINDSVSDISAQRRGKTRSLLDQNSSGLIDSSEDMDESDEDWTA